MTTIPQPPVTNHAPKFIFPARPINGGNLDRARPKFGQWLWEPKYNGWRVEIDVPTRTFWNRKGDPLSIAGEFDAAFARLAQISEASGITRFDCEGLERRHGIGQGSLFVLDWIPVNMRLPHLPDRLVGFYTLPWLQRSTLLDQHLTRLPCHVPPEAGGLYRPDLVPGTLETWAELQRLSKAWNPGGNPANDFYEGLVAKRIDSPYPLHSTSATQETPHWMKHRWAF